MKKTLRLRINEEHKDLIKAVINTYPDRYESESHFIRCAIRRLHDKEMGKNLPNWMRRQKHGV